MNKRQKILGAVGVLILVITSYFIYDHVMYVTTDNAQVESNTVLLASKVSGFIAKVNVSEGQRVKEGDVLVELDDRDYQNMLKQVKGDLTSVEARLKDSEKNYRRLAELLQKNAVSQQQFDTASSQYSDLKAKHSSIEAQYSQAELNLSNTRVKAPMDGIIARKSAEKGQLAAPGAPLIGFVGTKEKWVIANFKETDIDSIKIGAKVKMEVDAVSGKDFEGEVEAISSATGATFTLLPPDNATGNFTKVVQRVPVKIKLLNLAPVDNENLRAGLSVVAKVRKSK